MVEGGAEVARAFLDEGLVDRIGLFQGPSEIGPGGVLAPVHDGAIDTTFTMIREARFGDDLYREYVRSN